VLNLAAVLIGQLLSTQLRANVLFDWAITMRLGHHHALAVPDWAITMRLGHHHALTVPGHAIALSSNKGAHSPLCRIHELAMPSHGLAMLSHVLA